MNRRALLAAAIALSITKAQAGKRKARSEAEEKSADGCMGKPKCTDLSTCEEARRRLNDCGQQNLDRDHDGIPCESLCGDGKRKRR